MTTATLLSVLFSVGIHLSSPVPFPPFNPFATPSCFRFLCLISFPVSPSCIPLISCAVLSSLTLSLRQRSAMFGFLFFVIPLTLSLLPLLTSLATNILKSPLSLSLSLSPFLPPSHPKLYLQPFLSLLSLLSSSLSLPIHS